MLIDEPNIPYFSKPYRPKRKERENIMKENFAIMQNFNIFLIFGLLIIVEKFRFSFATVDAEDSGVLDKLRKNYSACSDKQPPSYECRKQLLLFAEQDGSTITSDIPSPECCSELRRWGSDCYYAFVAEDSMCDISLRTSTEIILLNTDIIWNSCQP